MAQSHASRGRGSETLGSEIRRSFLLPASSIFSTVCRRAFSSPFIAVRCSFTPYRLGGGGYASAHFTRSPSNLVVWSCKAIICTHSFSVGWFSVLGSTMGLFFSINSSMEYFFPESELTLHDLLPEFVPMQPVIPALPALRGGVGDVFPLFCPLDLVALRLHEPDKFLPAPGIAHTVLDGVHEPELPALPLGGGAVLSGGETIGFLLPLGGKYRVTVPHTQLVGKLPQVP